MANIVVRALKKFFSLILTPLFYGLVKLGKSLKNLNPFNWYKPGRSFIRALVTGGAAALGAYYGATSGAVLGTTIFPVIGTIIGAVIGAALGILIASSVAAFLSKYLLKALNTMGNRLDNEREVIENTASNPNKYALSKNAYASFVKKYPVPATLEEEPAPTEGWGKLKVQLTAVKTKKAGLGFWSSFYWTEEYAEKLKQNKLLKAIKANPLKAVDHNEAALNERKGYRWNSTPAAEDDDTTVTSQGQGRWEPSLS